MSVMLKVIMSTLILHVHYQDFSVFVANIGPKTLQNHSGSEHVKP